MAMSQHDGKGRRYWPIILLLLLLALVPFLLTRIQSDHNYSPVLSSAENRASAIFDRAQSQGEPRLYAFLHNMPKGGDPATPSSDRRGLRGELHSRGGG